MSCINCVSGSIDRGTPTGKEITVAGIPAYCALPPDGKSNQAVVIITDIFGWKVGTENC